VRIFFYNIDIIVKDEQRLRYHPRKCIVKLFTNLENEYIRENTHSHEPDNNKARSISISHALKQNALQYNERANEIVSSVTNNVHDSELGILNKNKSMIDLITKVRTRKNIISK
jgi:hypothetical protein